MAALVGELHAGVGRQPADSATDEDLAGLVAADTEFALRLYREVAAREPDDVFLSPYSVSTALSMAYAGARGKTATELADALRIDMEPETWHAARNRLELDMIENAAGWPPRDDVVPLTLEPTNAMFGQSDYSFEEQYLETLAANYGAGLQTVDFIGHTEEARVAINEWVADRTRDRIEELIEQGVLSDDTRAVLVNAIYFKATWAQPFDPEATQPMPFHLLDGSQRDVPMMSTGVKTSYVAGDGWQAVNVPYLGASMLVIVPDAGAFEAVENALDRRFLGELDDRAAEANVDLRLPRWESETAVSLPAALKEMGILDLFDPLRADLSGVTRVEPLFVSDVLHQANVSVDEEGTEAAAATAVVMDRVCACGDPPPVSLTVDRPFLYLIRDSVSGEILFIGRVLEPDA